MWMKVDDGLHAHRKTRAVTKSGGKNRDAAPMGLWVLAGSWAAQNNTDGWVPTDELDRWDDDWTGLAQRLVASGYWWPQERRGEPGYGFNDWHEYNPESEGASRSGLYGNHVRWHANKGVIDPMCDHCPRDPGPPESAPVDRPDSGGDIAPISGADRVRTSGGIALPGPTRPLPDPNPTPSSSAMPPRCAETAEVAIRDDTAALCDHLADRIEANGAKRPTVGKAWLDAARLMLDRDGRTETEIRGAIDWCQADEFWRSNILSMPKLRDKYDTLRLQAQRRAGPARRGDIDWDAAFARAAATDERNEEQAHG